jgi:cold shock CspA family protein
MPPSAAIETNIREKAAKLEDFYAGIMAGRVMIEAPHRHHHKGKAYQIRIYLTVPGGELVVNRAPKHLDTTRLMPSETSERGLTESHEPSRHGAHEDVYVAIRDAFNAAGRKLQDYARRRRGKVKAHEPTSHGRVTKLFPAEDYGFLETAEGREIYFHRNALPQAGYDRLEVGTEVQFVEELGKKGPQASTVRVAGKLVH